MADGLAVLEGEMEGLVLTVGECVAEALGLPEEEGVRVASPVVVADVEDVAEAELVVLLVGVEEPEVEAEAVELLLAEVEEEAVAVAEAEEVVLLLGVLVTLAQVEAVATAVALGVPESELVAEGVAV